MGDLARRNLVQGYHEGEPEVRPLPLFSASALTSVGVCSSSTAGSSETVKTDRAVPFVKPTELGEYDSDRDDDESIGVHDPARKALYGDHCRGTW